jgi:hypothetical protein
MLHLLKRHPIATSAHFDFTLALTFAVPAASLTQLLYPGLTLDDFEGHGFVCIAIVQTRQMRPSFMPAWLGGDFMLTGYRIFVRYRTREGRSLRGLQVLRSDTNRARMVMLGNVFTHYRYERAAIDVTRSAASLSVKALTRDHAADLDVAVDLNADDDVLPLSSPFPDAKSARRFAGPMPYTFSYEPETRSIVRIEGRRRGWKPKMVAARVHEAAFLKRFPEPRLASAFMVEDIPYSWQRGVLAKVGA